MRKHNFTKEQVENLYLNRKMSSYQVATELGCSQGHICDLLKEFNIPMRDHSESNIVRWNIQHYNDKGEKRCNACKRYLSVDEFNKDSNNRDGLNVACRYCARNKSYFHKYRITLEQYLEMLIEQKNKCACCDELLKVVESRRRNESNKVSLDHNHKTGKIRGIVCQRCNLAVIIFDNDVLFDQVISYLERYKLMGCHSLSAVLSVCAKEIDVAMRNYGAVKHYNEAGEKRCCTCKQYKSVNEFAKAKTKFDGFNAYCRRCAKSKAFQHKYGITVEQYELMFAEQNGECACCGKLIDFNDFNHVSIDHDHTAKKIRGIVCQRCNIAIFVFDNNALLDKVVSYLEKHK